MRSIALSYLEIPVEKWKAGTIKNYDGKTCALGHLCLRDGLPINDLNYSQLKNIYGDNWVTECWCINDDIDDPLIDKFQVDKLKAHFLEKNIELKFV